MAVTSNRFGDTLTRKARGTLGIRFGRFTIAAIAAFVTTEVVLTICAGPLKLTATWASVRMTTTMAETTQNGRVSFSRFGRPFRFHAQRLSR